jgi:hypothetical protein
LYYVDEEYRKAHPNLLTRNKPDVWLKAIRIAKENGLLYYFAKRVVEEERFLRDPFKKMVEQEERNLVKLKQTLDFINSLFRQEGLDVMFIKLYRGIPYTPRDVDILIRKEQSRQVFMALKRRNIKLEKFYGVETQFEEKGLLKVDLYQGFHYLSLDFLGDEFLWKNPRTVNICSVECIIPSYEADFLSLIIHAFLGHRYLSLLDFLYAKSLLNNDHLKFDELLYQVEKYKWSYIFQIMVSIIRDLYQELYSGSGITSIDFPYRFHPFFILKALNSAGLQINTGKKMAFILSTLIDNAFYEYTIVRRSMPIELPSEVKKRMMKSIHKIRSLSGDRKI